ncbi:MAG: methyltransferase domain-containing protein [Dehalococcoidia bacterium]
MRPEEYTAMYAVEDHHWWYTGMRAVFDALLGESTGSRRGALDILDAGCGTGGNAAHLRGYGRVVGIDVAAEALACARQRPGLRLARASVERLPFRSASFDVVLSNDVLCHLQVSDDGRAVAEFARVLRPGGVLYLQLPAFQRLTSHHDIAVHTQHRYTRPELARLLARAGLRPRRLTYANTLLFPAAAAWRLAHRHQSPDEVRGSDVRPAPALVDGALRLALRAEARVLRRRDLPFGLSVIGVARKPAAPTVERTPVAAGQGERGR